MPEDTADIEALKYALPDGLPYPYCEKGYELEFCNYLKFSNGDDRKAAAASPQVKKFLKTRRRQKYKKYPPTEKLRDFYGMHSHRIGIYGAYLKCLEDEKTNKTFPSFEYLALTKIDPEYCQRDIDDSKADEILSLSPGSADDFSLIELMGEPAKIKAAQAYIVLSSLKSEITDFESLSDGKKQAIINSLFAIASLNNDTRILLEAIDQQPAIEFYFSKLLCDTNGNSAEINSVTAEESEVNPDPNLTAMENIKRLKYLTDLLDADPTQISQSDISKIDNIVSELKSLAQYFPKTKATPDDLKSLFLQITEHSNALPWLDANLIKQLISRWLSLTEIDSSDIEEKIDGVYADTFRAKKESAHLFSALSSLQDETEKLKSKISSLTTNDLSLAEKRSNRKTVKSLEDQLNSMAEREMDLQDNYLTAASPFQENFDITFDYFEALETKIQETVSQELKTYFKTIDYDSDKEAEPVNIEDADLDESINDIPEPLANIPEPQLIESVEIEEPETEPENNQIKNEKFGIALEDEESPEEAGDKNISKTPEFALVNWPDKEVTNQYLGDDNHPNRHPVHQANLFWEMIDKGNSLIAYWFLKSLEESNIKSPELPPSDLLKAVALAPYVVSNHSAAANVYTESLRNLDMEEHKYALEQNSRPALHFLSVAATLQPCMFNPQALAAQVMKSSAGRFDQDFATLLLDISDLAIQQQNFTLNDFGNKQSAQNIAQEIESIKQKALDIQNHASNKSTGYYWANQVFKHVMLKEIFAPVIRILIDNKSGKKNINLVQDTISQYNTEGAIAGLLETVRHNLQTKQKRSEAVVGDARTFFVKQCKDLLELAESWLSIHEKQDKIHQRFRTTKIEGVIGRLLTIIPKTIEKLNSEYGSIEFLDEHAGHGILVSALENLSYLLRGDEGKRFKGSDPSVWIDLPLIMMGNPSSHSGAPQLADDLALFAHQGFDYINWTKGAIKSGNLSLANDVINEVERQDKHDQIIIDKVRLEIKAKADKEEEQLTSDLDSLSRRIDATLNANLLKDQEYTRYMQDIDMVRSEIDGQSYANFKELRELLLDIEDEIRELTENHLDKLDSEWKDLFQKAKDNKRLDDIPDGWVESLSSTMSDRNVTVAEEYIQQFRDYLETGTELFDYRNRGQRALSLFLDQQPGILEAIHNHGTREIAGWVKNGREIGPLDFSSVDQKPTAVFHAFDTVRQSQKGVSQGFLDKLLEILQFVGFGWHDKTEANAIDARGDGNMQLLMLPLTVGVKDSPVPSFGSMHDRLYPILIVRKFRGFDEIGQFLEANDVKTGAILLFIDPLTAEQRTDFAQFCHAGQFTLMALDIVLLLYLAAYSNKGKQETALRTAFKVCLPYTYDNPYVDALYPPPKEMVFGRHVEIERVLRRRAIIYGGRQLGKSTILREVESRTHKPSEHRYAYYNSADSITTDLTYEDTRRSLWHQIGSRLINDGIIKKPDPETAQAYRSALQTAFTNDKELRITILLDESDTLLQKDSNNDFDIFRGFRELFYATDQRFRVIIAGLQSVQRYANIPNNPLNQLGGSQVIGILPSSDAIRLIRDPLAALGFTFEDMNSVNRILAYTNCHAGLIQLFCHQLIVDLNRHIAAAKVQLPGYRITQRDIDNAYSNKYMRENIVDRFNLTLNLDPRYRLLAYGFIIEEKKLEYFNIKEAKDIGDQYWPEEFRDMSTVTLRAILEEMVGLGVLIHETGEENEDLYRFRNTNVFTLLGSAEVNRAKIKEITQQLNSDDPMQHHRRLGKADLYSPMTLSDELLLLGKLDALQSTDDERKMPDKKDRPAITIASVYGSKALGLMRLKDSLAKLMSLHDPMTDKLYRTFSISAEKLGKVSDLVKIVNIALEKSKDQAFILVIEMPNFADDPSMYIEYLEYLYSLKTRAVENPIWIILTFDPLSTWNWLGLRDSKNIETEGIHISLQRWHDAAISRLLNEHGMLSGERQLKFMDETTGGWYEFLKLFSDNAGEGKDDPERITGFNKKIEYCKNDKRQATHAIRDIGIEDVEMMRDLLGTIISEGFDQEIQTESIELLTEDNKDLMGREQQIIDWLARMGIVSSADRSSVDGKAITKHTYRIEPVTRSLLLTADKA